MYHAGLFSFLFLIILLFLGIRILLWLLFPNKMFVKNPNQGNRTEYYEKKEGDINIDYIPKKDKKIKNDTGDYTDYEELNDDA